MLEACQSTWRRGEAYIAEKRRSQFPNKLSDSLRQREHASPLRLGYTDDRRMPEEGSKAIIITQKNNEEFLDKALNTPRTLLDDPLAKNPKKAKFETVAEKRVYTDGTRTVEFYHIPTVLTPTA